MAKRLDSFTRAFDHSKIPFLLSEVITDGQGEMVDLLCRYINGAAAALVNLPPEALTGKRFSRLFPAERLGDLRTLQTVAFSGSAASFPYTTVMGHALTITCYQPAYGLAACVLDPWGHVGQDAAERMESLLPGAAAVLELNREGLRCLSFSQQMCRLTGRDRGELLERYARDLSALAVPGQWQDLLQALRDAARDGTPVDHDVCLMHPDGSERWVNLRAQVLSTRGATTSFFSVLLDVDEHYRSREQLRQVQASLARTREELQSLLDNLPGGYCLLRREGETLTPLHMSQGLAGLLGYSREELQKRMAADPLFSLAPEEREEVAAQGVRCRLSGQTLRRICRALRKGGGSVWLSVEVVWKPRGNNCALIYAVCTDVSREREASEELRFQSQLCGLLLEHSRTLRFDYDPQSDTGGGSADVRPPRRPDCGVPGQLRRHRLALVPHLLGQSPGQPGQRAASGWQGRGRHPPAGGAGAAAGSHCPLPGGEPKRPGRGPAGSHRRPDSGCAQQQKRPAAGSPLREHRRRAAAKPAGRSAGRGTALPFHRPLHPGGPAGGQCAGRLPLPAGAPAEHRRRSPHVGGDHGGAGGGSRDRPGGGILPLPQHR